MHIVKKKKEQCISQNYFISCLSFKNDSIRICSKTLFVTLIRSFIIEVLATSFVFSSESEVVRVNEYLIACSSHALFRNIKYNVQYLLSILAL